MGQYKEFDTNDCLDALMDHIVKHPESITEQIIVHTQSENIALQKYMKYANDRKSWQRLSTNRPELTGDDARPTDMVVRVFDNEDWYEDNKLLRGSVTTEFGEITSITFEIDY